MGAARSGRQSDVHEVLNKIEQRANPAAGAQYSAPDETTQAQIDAALSSFLQSPGGEVAMRHMVTLFLWRGSFISPLASLDRDARAEFAALREGQKSVVEWMLRCAMRHRQEKPLPPR